MEMYAYAYAATIAACILAYVAVPVRYAGGGRVRHAWLELLLSGTLLLLVCVCAARSEYALAAVLALVLAEHVRQVWACYRQHTKLQHAATLVLELATALYAIHRHQWEVACAMALGSLLHVADLFSVWTLEPVCLK